MKLRANSALQAQPLAPRLKVMNGGHHFVFDFSTRHNVRFQDLSFLFSLLIVDSYLDALTLEAMPLVVVIF